MSSEVLIEGGKSLVQPQVAPPKAGDQIPEPLVRELVRHDGGCAQLSREACVLLVEQQVRFPVGIRSRESLVWDFKQ